MYATYNEFLASINTDSLPEELLDQTIIESALDDASALILSYITIPYDALIEPYDRALKRRCIDIAYYYLMSKRGFNMTTAGDVCVANDYNSAIEYLKSIQKGSVILTNRTDSNNNLRNQPFVV